jgi:hypothetical protein
MLMSEVDINGAAVEYAREALIDTRDLWWLFDGCGQCKKHWWTKTGSGQPGIVQNHPPITGRHYVRLGVSAVIYV